MESGNKVRSGGMGLCDKRDRAEAGGLEVRLQPWFMRPSKRL